MLRHTVLISALLSLSAYCYEFTTLPLSDLKKELGRSCSFVHVWATWCSICVQEMPSLIRGLEKEKKVYPVIIDASKKFTQEKFSKPFFKNINPKFNVFRKPDVTDDALMHALGVHWDKSLPYSALFSYGKKKKEWLGAASVEELHKAFQELCPQK